MQTPKISIIIPCYNYGHLLGETLGSIQMQTYINWECIVVDDGSKDKTAEVVKYFADKDPRFIYFYQQNKGMSAARNAGMKLAKGDFIQFIDSDDKISSQKFEVQLQAFAKDPTLDIVYGNPEYFYIDSNGNQAAAEGYNTNWMAKTSGGNAELLRDVVVQNLMVISAPLCKKSALERIGPHNSVYWSGEDWEYWFRAVFHGLNILYDPDVRTNTQIRIHRGSMFSNKIKNYKYEILLRKQFDTYLKGNIEVRKLNKSLIAKARRNYVTEILRSWKKKMLNN